MKTPRTPSLLSFRRLRLFSALCLAACALNIHALEAGSGAGSGSEAGAGDAATPANPLDFLVGKIDEMAQKRMKISEGFVTVSRNIARLRSDKADDEKAMKEANASLDTLRETYKKTDAAKAWPVISDGIEYSEDMFKGLIKIKLGTKADLATRLGSNQALIDRDNKTLANLKFALELLNAGEEKLKRSARDFNRDRVTPDMQDIFKAVQSVDVDKLFRDAGINGDKFTPDRAPDITEESKVSDEELDKFLSK